MQHLDRRLEHLDEFQDSLVGAIETAGVAVRVRIVLGVGLKLADIDLADQRRDVLVVLVTGLRLRYRDLPQTRGMDLGDAEARNVAAEGFEPLIAPWAHQAVEATARNAIL